MGLPISTIKHPGILLMLLLSVISSQRVSSVPSCPASCVVCSEDAVICHRLAHIIGNTHAVCAAAPHISVKDRFILVSISGIGFSPKYTAIIWQTSQTITHESSWSYSTALYVLTVCVCVCV